MEYNEVTITLTNTGNEAVTGTLYETALPLIFTSDIKGWSVMPASIEAGPGETVRLEVPTKGRSFLRLFLKRSATQEPTTVNVVASYQ